MSSAVEVPPHMWALMKKAETESYVHEQIPTPAPEGSQVLIHVDAVSICGSDIALYKWDAVAKVIATVPFIPGHECVGTVVQRGPAAEERLPLGTRVAVENHFFCGQCHQCRHDRGDICQNMGQYGHGKQTMHGGCSQYSIIESKYCYRLTSNITDEEAVLMEPCGVAHNAMEALEVSGEDVLVIGAGPVGLMGITCAKALGASRVFAADIDASRLELAKKIGADILVNTLSENIKEVMMRETGGDGIGRICEMSGADVMANNMFSYLRKGGHVVLVGLLKKPLHVESPLPDIVFKSLTLKTIHGRRIFHTWEECERLLAEKKINILPVVSHRVPMSRFEEAFSALFSGKACKIIMDPHH